MTMSFSIKFVFLGIIFTKIHTKPAIALETLGLLKIPQIYDKHYFRLETKVYTERIHCKYTIYMYKVHCNRELILRL